MKLGLSLAVKDMVWGLEGSDEDTLGTTLTVTSSFDLGHGQIRRKERGVLIIDLLLRH